MTLFFPLLKLQITIRKDHKGHEDRKISRKDAKVKRRDRIAAKEHSAAEPQPNHGGTPWGLVKAVCEDSTNTSNPRGSGELS
jgi:hypothetical protein